MAVYREIVFNNILASISACFPVLLSIVGKRVFRRWVRQCVASQDFNSPYFQDIPASFVRFLQAQPAETLTPTYAAQLAHYEWLELLISRQVGTGQPAHSTLSHADALASTIVHLADCHQLQQYDYPVHQLSKKNAAATPQQIFLLIYRTPDFQIRFMTLNAITFKLLQQIQTHTATAEAHLQQLAQMTPEVPAETLRHFGLSTLYQLHQTQALWA